MRSTGTIVSIICGLAAVGLAIGLAAEHQAWSNLNQANAALRQQLSQLGLVTAENRRLSEMAARAQATPARPNEPLETPPAADARAKELVRLRGEVEAFRQQTKEIETLREDTRQLRAAQEKGLKPPGGGQAAAGSGPTTVNGSPFEIVKAEYWTANTNLDVAAELRERVRNDGLKAVASNNLKGDPDFGQAKRLTVVYRFGGVTRTNEFREGDVIVLPGE